MTDSVMDERPAVYIRADGRRAQLAIVSLLLVVAAAAFVAAIPGLLWLGELAGLGGLAATVPVVVDGGQLVAAAALAARRTASRPAGWEAATLAGLVLLSASSQALHAWTVARPDQAVAATVMACVLAAALPLTVLASTHAATRAVLAPPARRRAAQRPTVPARPARAAQPAAPAARRAVDTSASRPREGAATAPAPAVMALEEAVDAARSGRLSQRQAAMAAGVSRHRIAQAVTA